MAEATLNDVSTAIKEDGSKDREQFKGDSLRQFFQARASNKFLKSLTQAQIDSNEQTKKQFEKEQEALKKALKTKNDDDGSVAYNKFQLEEINKHLALLTQTEVASNEQMKKRFEQEQEALRRANAKKTLGEPANDNDTRFQRIITKLIAGAKGVINVLDKMKKALPDKKTVFGLLFGGLAAAFAFFPEWSKRNLINPLIDVINVFQGNDATTTLGSVVKALKGGLEWISENIAPEAAWVVGIAGVATALTLAGLPTFGVGPLAIKALKTVLSLVMAFPAAAFGILAVVGIYKALQLLKDIAVNDELEILEKQRKKLRDAVASEDEKAIKASTSRLRETMTRMENTGLIRSKAIRDKMVETQAELSAIASKNQAEALARLNEVTSLAADKSVTKQLVSEIKLGAGAKFAEIGKKDTVKQVEALEEQLGLIDQNTSLSASDKELLVDVIVEAARKRFDGNFDTAIDKKGGIMHERLKAADDVAIDKKKQLADKKKQLADKDMFGEMTGESSGLIYRSPEEVSHIKTAREVMAEIMGKGGTSQNQKQAEKLAANAKDNDRSRNQENPIVPVVASDSRDMSVTNYNITNVFGGRTDPLEGLYGGPNPSSQ